MKRKTIIRALQTVFLFIVFYVAILYFAQDSMVYHPGRYDENAEAFKGRTLVHIDYQIAGGSQVAFYMPPVDGSLPQRLWILFGGNGAVVLQYAAGLPLQKSLMNDGFLLIDYPGYGYNQGKPSGAAIQESADIAFTMLAGKLRMDPQTLLAHSGLVGHSLGTGAALEFAAAHPALPRIVLVAPFTSLYDMAFRQAGPAAHLLHHNFDNAAVLHELSLRDPRPQVVIATGEEDQVIPIAMSRKLARDNPWLTYHEMPGYEHNHIVDEAAPQIAGYMAGMK